MRSLQVSISSFLFVAITAGIGLPVFGQSSKFDISYQTEEQPSQARSQQNMAERIQALKQQSNRLKGVAAAMNTHRVELLKKGIDLQRASTANSKFVAEAEKAVRDQQKVVNDANQFSQSHPEYVDQEKVKLARAQASLRKANQDLTELNRNRKQYMDQFTRYNQQLATYKKALDSHNQSVSQLNQQQSPQNNRQSTQTWNPQQGKSYETTPSRRRTDPDEFQQLYYHPAYSYDH